MTFPNQLLFAKDSVYIHINVQDAKDKEAHIAGRVFLLEKPEGHFVEWKAEEFMADTQNEEWDIIGPVGYRSDRDADTVTMNPKMETRRKYNISFNLLDLNSFKRNTPSNGWAFIIFILKDGTTFPALHFHNGGSNVFVKELEKRIQIRRSPNDSRLFIVQHDDPEMLSKSFNELDIFTDCSGTYVQKFIKDPYTSTLGGFSKVTNFFRDNLLTPDNLIRPQSEMAEFFHGEGPDVEFSQLEESGFELVTKTNLPPQPTVKRSDPLTLQHWLSFFDAEGKTSRVDDIKEIIFRGGVDPGIRSEVWKFLLGFYDWDTSAKQRQEQRKRKVDDYFRMKLQWKTISAEQERRFTILRDRRALIEKDVMRTDRTQKFFSGDKNPNVQVLYDILMTYGLYNFDLGYVQGMSDILSPILFVLENEVEAFWCFAGAMERICHNFEMDQKGMKLQLSQIHTLMQVYDPDLCSYLESHESGNFYFCFRWILIQFKREFSFHDIQRLWEVLWTEKPCANFHLIISLAILGSEKSTLVENKFGFTEILKHINDMSSSIPLEETLCKAEGIFLQFRDYKKLPKVVKGILGLDPVTGSASVESNLSVASSSSTDVKSSSGTKPSTPDMGAGVTGRPTTNSSVNSTYYPSSAGRNSYIDQEVKILT